jgi:hypothetical protein
VNKMFFLVNESIYAHNEKLLTVKMSKYDYL